MVKEFSSSTMSLRPPSIQFSQGLAVPDASSTAAGALVALLVMAAIASAVLYYNVIGNPCASKVSGSKLTGVPAATSGSGSGAGTSTYSDPAMAAKWAPAAARAWPLLFAASILFIFSAALGIAGPIVPWLA